MDTIDVRLFYTTETFSSFVLIEALHKDLEYLNNIFYK